MGLVVVAGVVGGRGVYMEGVSGQEEYEEEEDSARHEACNDVDVVDFYEG